MKQQLKIFFRNNSLFAYIFDKEEEKLSLFLKNSNRFCENILLCFPLSAFTIFFSLLTYSILFASLITDQNIQMHMEKLRIDFCNRSTSEITCSQCTSRVSRSHMTAGDGFYETSPSSDDDVNVESTFCNESYHEMEIN